MMKSFFYLLNLVLLCSAAPVTAKPLADFREQKPAADALFFPAVNDPEWVQLKNFPAPPPEILLSAVYQPGTDSVAYYLKITSPAQYPNLSAETMECREKTYHLIAVADLTHQKWLKLPTMTTAKKLDLNLNSLTPIRKEIYTALCLKVFPKTKQELNKRLRR